MRPLFASFWEAMNRRVNVLQVLRCGEVHFRGGPCALHDGGMDCRFGDLQEVGSCFTGYNRVQLLYIVEWMQAKSYEKVCWGVMWM